MSHLNESSAGVDLDLDYPENCEYTIPFNIGYGRVQTIGYNKDEDLKVAVKRFCQHYGHNEDHLGYFVFAIIKRSLPRLEGFRTKRGVPAVASATISDDNEGYFEPSVPAVASATISDDNEGYFEPSVPAVASATISNDIEDYVEPMSTFQPETPNHTVAADPGSPKNCDYAVTINMGFGRVKQLAYNIGEDMELAAKRFCEHNNIDETLIPFFIAMIIRSVPKAKRIAAADKSHDLCPSGDDYPNSEPEVFPLQPAHPDQAVCELTDFNDAHPAHIRRRSTSSSSTRSPRLLTSARVSRKLSSYGPRRTFSQLSTFSGLVLILLFTILWFCICLLYT